MAAARPHPAPHHGEKPPATALTQPPVTMKTILTAALFAAITSSALAGVPVGLGDLSASVDATATYDTNVFGTPVAIADYSTLLVPRLTYTRKAGLVQADAGAGVSIIRYRDQTQLNAENLDANATLQVLETDFRNYSGLISGIYRETSDLNTDLNTRLNTKTTIFTTRSALITGPRSNAALSGTYTDTRISTGDDQQVLNTEALYDYKDFFYGNSLRLVGSYDQLHSSDGSLIGVPLNQNSYVMSAGLGRGLYHDTLRGGVSYGYRVLNRSEAEVLATGGERRRSGYVVGASLEGPFLPVRYFPKVTSLFSLAYQDAATPGIYDTGSKELTGRLSVIWKARENTSVSLAAQRVQRLAVNDQSVVTTTSFLSVEQTLRLNLTGTLGAGYDWSTYRSTSRNDRTARLSAGLRYNFARVWDARLTSVLTSNKSTLPIATYDRTVTSISLTRTF